MAKQLVVYFDAQCPMCVAGAERFQQFDANHKLRFVDLHDPYWAEQAASRFSPSDLNRAMRVHLPDGTWRAGYFAWAVILENLPTWRWLGRVMHFPLFYGIGPLIYQWVALHRLQISHTLGLPPPCDANGVCRLRPK